MEHFQWDPLWTGKNSVDCYAETPSDCLTYSNCGLCYKEGQPNPSCVPGDINGSIETGCKKWKYTDYYGEDIFNRKITRTVDSWDRFLPGFESKNIDPIAMSVAQ